jgi:phage host-nuclease inhibitor protein Gam
VNQADLLLDEGLQAEVEDAVRDMESVREDDQGPESGLGTLLTVRTAHADPRLQPWEPSQEDEETVERYLRALRFYRAEVADVNRLADMEIERIEERRAHFLRSAQGAVAYLEARLRQFSECVGRKRRKSVNGTIGWRKAPHRVVIEDDDYFCSRAEEEFVRTTVAPDKKAIADHIRSTGDVPEGADWVRGEDSFKIDTPE